MDDLLMLSVGGKCDLVKHYPEGVICETFDQSGLFVFFNYNRPTQAEIKAFSACEHGEIRFVRIRGILFLLFKIGDLEWAEAPYAVQLSNGAAFPPLEEGMGYPVTLVLIDRVTTEIKAMRLIGLGNNFSNALRKEIESCAEEVIIAPQYYQQIAEVQNAYSTKDLVKMSSHRYRFGT